jgi:Holliday junction DNA helicase RuvA
MDGGVIGRLTGRVEGMEADRCLVDVGGVGYVVMASTRTLGALEPGAEQRLWIETVVREDAITLYGFLQAAEREWFRILTGVQGVGPKVALGILSALTPSDLVAAIQAGDRAMLSRAPGVGPKLAIRLATELRDKVGALPLPDSVSVAASQPVGPDAEVLSALGHLGYRRVEAEAALAKVRMRLGAEAVFADLVRESLREMAR